MAHSKNDPRSRRPQARPLLKSAALAVAATVTSACGDSHMASDPSLIDNFPGAATGGSSAQQGFGTGSGGTGPGYDPSVGGAGGTFCNCPGTGGRSPGYEFQTGSGGTGPAYDASVPSDNDAKEADAGTDDSDAGSE